MTEKEVDRKLDALTKNPLVALLEKHEACGEAIAWVKGGGYTDLQSAWNACERGDWMLWLYAKMDGDRKKLVLAAAACAETAMPVWERYSTTDRRPQECIEVARKWARGEATDAELSAASAEAAWAARAAWAAWAAWAARAAWAAGAAEAAGAAWAAGAAEAAGAAWAARAAERARALKECADLARSIIPNPESEK